MLFRSALPVADAFNAPNADQFESSDQLDDHYGPAQIAYHEDFPSDGFHRIASTTDPNFELVPADTVDTAPLCEGDICEDLPTLWTADDELPCPSSTNLSNLDRPLIQEPSLYSEPLATFRRSQRIPKPRTIFDPSEDYASAVDTIFFQHEPHDRDFECFRSFYINGSAGVTQPSTGAPLVPTIEGEDPSPFLPEPLSFKTITKLPPPQRHNGY